MKYFELLDKHCQYDYSQMARPRLSRAHTMKFAYEEMLKIKCPVIFELGTTRSFVHGGLEGCAIPDEQYWQPDNPEAWDFSAGAFTRVFGELPNKILHTVDLIRNHINVAKKITDGLGGIFYHVGDATKFLENIDLTADLIYSDVGDMTPLEDTARLHEEEAHIIIDRELVNIGGYVLIDDVHHPYPLSVGEKSAFGKAKYSVGVFLAGGFDIVMDEYQLLLKRIR
jgi:hypothetical protein